MDDWKIIWNSFCDEVAESVKKKNLEKVFEENYSRWDRYLGMTAAMTQVPVPTATTATLVVY